MHFFVSGVSKMPFFWYWGLENAFMYMKVLKLPIFGIGGLENAFLYIKVLKLPIFAIGGIKNVNFGMVEVPKIRKMSCLPPHLCDKCSLCL